MPDHRDLYVIVVGVVLGLLLGPAVLGRLSPDVYDRMLVDLNAGQVEMQAALQAQIDQRLKRLEATGSTGVAQEQITAELTAAAAAAENQRLDGINDRLDQRVGWLLGLMVIAGLVMVGETLIEPQAASSGIQRIRDRLVSSRYALLSLSLAIMLAQPALLRRLPFSFIGVGAAIVLVAVIVPWPKRRA